MMDQMVDAGVEVVQFGVENIQLSTRSSMHKRLEQRAIEEAFDLVLGRPGVLANPLYMLAYPGESWADCEANAAFIKAVGSDKRVLTYLSFTTPYPGTGFAKSIAKTGGVVLTKNLKYYTNKFPVFIPSSMLGDGIDAALQHLVDCYDDIAACVNRSFAVQRPIPQQFFADIDVTFVGRANDRR
jgi:hypothetical protein